jgi:hypothetical protein
MYLRLGGIELLQVSNNRTPPHLKILYRKSPHRHHVDPTYRLPYPASPVKESTVVAVTPRVRSSDSDCRPATRSVAVDAY